MSSNFRLANDAWNTFYRAQATVAREFSDADIWDGLLTREYGVLYALSTEPDGLRMSQLNEDALLTQPGMSRLITRLEARGLVARRDDAGDARARRICLTPAGADIQHRVGAAVAHQIFHAMTHALDKDQLESLRIISQALLDSVSRPSTPVQRTEDDD